MSQSCCVDSAAVSAFNRGELTVGHFPYTVSGCATTDDGRKSFLGADVRRMETQTTHPAFEYRLSYRRPVATTTSPTQP